jgi:hypothetical protein
MLAALFGHINVVELLIASADLAATDSDQG